ncbi:MAG: methyltransferase domain-containing protein, partial [Pseudomonadota bacterium]
MLIFKPSFQDVAIIVDSIQENAQLPHQIDAGVNAAKSFSIESLLFRDENIGKSLIEVGSRDGEFCLRCKEFGFGEVTGVDADPQRISTAVQRSDASNAGVNFNCAEFEETNFENNSFDFVVCRGVLHHVYEPFSALKKMMSVARQGILIEFDDLLRSGSIFERTLLRVLRDQPIVKLGKSRKLSSYANPNFLFTPASFQELFNRRSASFDVIEVSSSPVDGRHVIYAAKRSIENLLVVAGPSSSGKSTIINRLMERKLKLTNLPELTGKERALEAGKLHKMSIGNLTDAVFHYDITRTAGNSMRTVERDPTARILDICSKVNVITLLPSPERLQHQFVNNDSDENPHSARKKMLGELYFNDHVRLNS